MSKILIKDIKDFETWRGLERGCVGRNGKYELDDMGLPAQFPCMVVFDWIVSSWDSKDLLSYEYVYKDDFMVDVG